MDDKPTLALIANGYINIIVGTTCSKRGYIEYGCAWPNCARLSGERYTDIEHAKIFHPDLEIVD